MPESRKDSEFINPVRKILGEAQTKNYAVGSFNVFNLETIQAVFEACQDLNAPALVQVWAGLFDMGIVDAENINELYEIASNQYDVEVYLHLDHGKNYNHIMQAIQAGFSSVMIDASDKNLKENIKLTREVVKTAHAVGVTVEAELGELGGENNTGNSNSLEYTDPDEAKRFVEETGVDSLAVAIGNKHGEYEKKPELELTLLEEIHEKADIPLVLHGASFIPLEQISSAIKRGVAKINVATELNHSMIKGMKNALDRETQFPNEVIETGKKSMTAKVKEKIEMFNISN